MLDPRGIVRLHQQAIAGLRLERGLGTSSGPALLVILRGFIDAGNAGQIAASHLLTVFKSTRVATFDLDQLLDYRSKRALMTLENAQWTQYEEPLLALDHLVDADGQPFLLLHGTEPDFQWERVIAAIRHLVRLFGVSLVVGLHGIPLPVPHTRSLTLTARGTRASLTEDYASFFAQVRVPSSLAALLELRLGQGGVDAMGFAVHVPYYFARSQYPPAAVFGLQHVERVTGLNLTSDRLSLDSAEITKAVESEVNGSEELQTLITTLEEQFDQFAAQSPAARLVDAEGLIPTADALAEEFERYLREQDQA